MTYINAAITDLFMQLRPNMVFPMTLFADSSWVSELMKVSAISRPYWVLFSHPYPRSAAMSP